MKSSPSFRGKTGMKNNRKDFHKSGSTVHHDRPPFALMLMLLVATPKLKGKGCHGDPKSSSITL